MKQALAGDTNLPDVSCALDAPALHRLAGLVCTGYGSSAATTDILRLPASGVYGVLYVTAGSGSLTSTAAKRSTMVEAGNLVWLLPGVAHALRPDPSGWSLQWAWFDGGLARTFEALGLLSRSRPVARPQDTGRIAALFAQLRLDAMTGASLAALLAGTLIPRLVFVTHDDAAAPVLLDQKQGLRRAVAVIEASALMPVDVRAVAETCGVGYSTLRRSFKRSTGQTITDYLLRRRLDAGKTLLLTTSLSVAEVSHAVGFADPYYFSRQFRRSEGLPPRSWRARHRPNSV
jgi:AraC-like DNA-binding protein